jgi:glutamine synthetase
MSSRARSSSSFVERHRLWTDEQSKAAAAIDEAIAEHELEVVRFSFADQHGILRGKTIVAAEAASVLRNGCTLTTTLLAKDTSHRTVFPVFTAGGGFGMGEMQGGGDFLMIADPTTFRILPWADGTGWVLCDIYFPDGRPVPFSTRKLYHDQLTRLAEAGFDFMAGLEVEFHLYRLVDPRLAPADATWPAEPPEVTLVSQGFQLLTETRYDLIDPVMETIRRDVTRLGLPLRSVELELGPSQCEFTFAAQVGLAPADTMVLFRSAVKQIARRHGLLASFMCRPRLPNAFSSGWHLHQSLLDIESKANAFVGKGDDGALSRLGRHYLAGLLAHARAAAAFTTPTLNGYKRYRAYQLAPDRAIWARDNRGVMVRVLGAPGDPATHLENRVGEPAANPYLYMASQIAAGLDGIARKLDPGPSADTPYETPAEPLPKSLDEALAALRASACFRAAFGDGFVDYYLKIKEAEIARFQAEVTDWEHKEYFDLF